MSLPILTDLANAPGVSADSPLRDVQQASKAVLRNEMPELIEQSDAVTVRMMPEVCDAIKRKAECAKALCASAD